MVLSLYNLENSRSMRVHWLICELDAPVQVRNYKRIDGKKAEPAMAKDSGYKLGKSPCLVEDEADGLPDKRLVVVESSNCMMYLVERFAPKSELLPSPPDFHQRTKVIGWMDFSETIMTHALAIVYVQWFAPEGQADVIDAIREKAKVNVLNDMDEIESELERHGGPYILGETFTLADIALAFSCEYVLFRKVGTQGHPTNWPRIHSWLRRLAQRPAYHKALREGGKYEYTVT